MNTQDIVTRFKADTSDLVEGGRRVVQVMQKIDKTGAVVNTTLKVTERQASAASRSMSGFEKSLKRTATAMASAYIVGRSVSSTFKGIFDAATEGARNDAAAKFFISSGKSLSELRTATQGLISDAELMKKANLADSMGISTDTFKVLAKVAQASALKTGQSFEHMFESIVVGTARSSRLLLDNLGIIVSVEQANKNYAASELKKQGTIRASDAELNKYIESMSDEAKKIAFAEEVQKQAAGTLSEFAALGGTTAAEFDKTSAAVQNAADSIKRDLASALIPVLPMIRSLSQWLASIAALPDLSTVISLTLGGEGAWFVKQLMSGANIFDMPVSKAAGMAGNQQAFANLGADFNLDTGLDPYEALDSLATSADFADYVLEQFGQEAKDTLLLMADLAKKSDITAKRLEVASGPPAAGGAPKAGKFSKNPFDSKGTVEGRLSQLRANENAMWRKLHAKEEKEWARFWDDLTADPSIDKLQQEQKRMAEAAELAAVSLGELQLELDTLNNRGLGEFVSGVAGGQGLFGPALQGITTAIGGSLSSSISSGISALLGGGAAAGSIAGPLGAIIGALLPVLMQLLDELQPVTEFLAALTDGLRLLITNGFNELLKLLVMLNEPVRHLLAAVGTLVGAALRPFINVIYIAVFAVGTIIEALAWFLVVLGPFVEVIASIIAGIVSSGLTLAGTFLNTSDLFLRFSNSMEMMTDAMIDNAIYINNGIVKFMRDTFGLQGFGKFLDKDDFESPLVDALEDNEDAVKENTKALRDFAREFRNLPQGYKVEGSLFAAEAPRASTRTSIGRTAVFPRTPGRDRT